MYVVTLSQIAVFASICCVMQLVGNVAAEILIRLFDKIKKCPRMRTERKAGNKAGFLGYSKWKSP